MALPLYAGNCCLFVVQRSHAAGLYTFDAADKHYDTVLIPTKSAAALTLDIDTVDGDNRLASMALVCFSTDQLLC